MTIDRFLENGGFMARIVDEVIERIKTEVSLVQLAESQSYAPQKQGKDFVLCCPFHADKTPSCIITPKSNLFNCFGCGVGGSVIDWSDEDLSGELPSRCGAAEKRYCCGHFPFSR